MQLHELKTKSRIRKKTRVGRGGKRGKTSGSGNKGQKARGTPRPEIRDVIKRIPKNRGYRFKSIKTKPRAVNIKVINEKFNDGEVVSPETLFAKKIINSKYGDTLKIKILSDGEIYKKIIVDNCLVSEKASEKIKKAGGEIREIKHNEANLARIKTARLREAGILSGKKINVQTKSKQEVKKVKVVKQKIK